MTAFETHECPLRADALERNCPMAFFHGETMEVRWITMGMSLSSANRFDSCLDSGCQTKTPRSLDFAGFRRHFWRRRREAFPTVDNHMISDGFSLLIWIAVSSEEVPQ